MNILCKHFFTDTCFTANHHRCIERGNLIGHTDNRKCYFIGGNKIGFIKELSPDMFQLFMKTQPLLVSGFNFFSQMMDLGHITDISDDHFDLIVGAEHRRTGNQRLPPRAKFLLQCYRLAGSDSD